MNHPHSMRLIPSHRMNCVDIKLSFRYTVLTQKTFVITLRSPAPTANLIR